MDDLPPITEAEFLGRSYYPDMPTNLREQALIKRWSFVSGMSLRIFELLMQQNRWMYITEMMETLGKKHSQSITQPLQQLQQARMVEEKREGSRAYYRLRSGLAELYQQRVTAPAPKPMHARIFELLTQKGELYQAQLFRQLGEVSNAVMPGIIILKAIGVVEEEHKQTSYGQVFYRLRPKAAERYQQWLAEQASEPPA